MHAAKEVRTTIENLRGINLTRKEIKVRGPHPTPFLQSTPPLRC